MLNPVRNITFDALDPWKVARFWSEVTGYAIAEDGVEGDEEIQLEPGQPGVRRACCSSGYPTARR
ncbi:VOC family protein [Streptomyces cirratus]